MTELTKPFLELADVALRFEPSFKKDFNNHFVRDLGQSIRTLVAMLEESQEVVWDVFNQSCQINHYGIKELNDHEFLYDHMHLSAYEGAQDYLIKIGRIKPEECSRK
mgnify:CR=1 FL=1